MYFEYSFLYLKFSTSIHWTIYITFFACGLVVRIPEQQPSVLDLPYIVLKLLRKISKKFESRRVHFKITIVRSTQTHPCSPTSVRAGVIEVPLSNYFHFMPQSCNYFVSEIRIKMGTLQKDLKTSGGAD